MIESNISPTQRKNLGEIAKTLHQISTGKLFSGNEPYQVHLNDYIRVSASKFKSFLREVQTVPPSEEYFEMNEFADSSHYKKPRIFISPEEIYQVHRNLEVYLKDLVFSFLATYFRHQKRMIL